ncbi:MAG TPA: DUF3298 and DUF4163 domain-containing protein [Sphingopyxis sp.]|uniref:DUF3298 and DUF4163 domain-containing protein n=1 Tax=Sphingopyxis sp. TaxID=1908224 RepID=UPI002B5F2468|nr:DUF3298 and DUF4163 domain-containing protein [Sphingopyxis sp.]HWW58469.1 DUF3298 and DUF4163 domain-containing protein [Sphingopyxis sp.]
MTRPNIWRNAIPTLAAAALLAGCSDPEPTPAEKAAAASVPGAPPGGAADLAVKNAPASKVEEKTGLVEFAYSYPREAAAIPELAAWLDGDRATKRDALIAAAQRDKAAAEKGGFPYRAHSHLQKWQRVTDTRRFLSLSAEIDTYAGGAHGMQGFGTLIWDRNRRKLLQPLDLFASGEAFDAAIRDSFCAGIKRAKTAKGIVADEPPDSPFAQCPPASAQTVWLGSSDGRYLDRVTVAIAPYEIGPYAEGSYKINVPMSGELVRAVKDEYARDFLPLN